MRTNPQETADLFTFTKEILNGKLHFLCSGMDETAPLKKSPYMKKLMAQADPSKEASTVKKMNDRLLLLSSNKMMHYFKKWTTPSSVLKKEYVAFTKI